MTMKMKKTANVEEIQAVCETAPMALLYFTGNQCSACEAIKQKIAFILASYPFVQGIEVDGEQSIAIAAQYGVFSLPYFMLYVEGKLTVAEGRHVDLLAFERRLDRYYKMIFK